jgi:hypothetical protein
MRSPAHGHTSIEVFADGDGTTGQGIAKTRFVQLEIAVLQNNRIVVSNPSLRLDGKHPIQILAPAFTERRPFLSCRFGELAVEFGDVSIAQKRIRLLQCADSGEPQLLRQSVLPRAEAAFWELVWAGGTRANRWHVELSVAPGRMSSEPFGFQPVHLFEHTGTGERCKSAKRLQVQSDALVDRCSSRLSLIYQLI